MWEIIVGILFYFCVAYIWGRILYLTSLESVPLYQKADTSIFLAILWPVSVSGYIIIHTVLNLIKIENKIFRRD